MKRGKFIPESTEASEQPPEVPILPPPMAITAKEATQLAENLGLVKVSAGQIEEMNKLGVYLTGQGIYRTLHGEAMIARRKFAGMMDKIMEKAMKEDTTLETMLDAGKVLAQMQDKLNGSMKVTREVADSQKAPASNGRPSEPPANTNPSFPVGSTQIVAQSVQINHAPPASGADKNPVATTQG